MIETLSRLYYNRGLEQARAQRISAAVQELTKAVSCDSNNIEAWNLAGLCYYRLAKYKTAETCWKCSLHQRHEENAANGYLENLLIALTESEQHFARVTSFCAEKKYKHAAALLRKDIYSRFGLSADLQNLLGVLLMLEGKPKAAAKCWTTVLAIDPANTDAARYLAETDTGFSSKLRRLTDKLLKRNVEL